MLTVFCLGDLFLCFGSWAKCHGACLQWLSFPRHLTQGICDNSVLTLWRCDPTLITALDVCKALIAPTDYLTALWPSQRK